ncbi:hypothetical protein SISSUDRAFT_873630 [Sistotremastrum suecicum HHB10207 ss-3]|uniref:Uncharacterized protein n=1 Tax=Sistotremastrum suecicum HHB10207 ss-3 TaxID=1314776 RepID=A0A166CDH1_9AGAM|nr:hypothetical protein SISSUDRAFT_873630 [Sistotremastrum suecicum HHB10207 ss-3]
MSLYNQLEQYGPTLGPAAQYDEMNKALYSPPDQTNGLVGFPNENYYHAGGGPLSAETLGLNLEAHSQMNSLFFAPAQNAQAVTHRYPYHGYNAAPIGPTPGLARHEAVQAQARPARRLRHAQSANRQAIVGQVDSSNRQRQIEKRARIKLNKGFEEIRLALIKNNVEPPKTKADMLELAAELIANWGNDE